MIPLYIGIAMFPPLVGLGLMFLWLRKVSLRNKEILLLLKEQGVSVLKRNRFLGRLDKILESSAPMMGR